MQIIWIDLLLSGDNAVVIALACRRLPEQQRKWGIILGSGAAIVLRVVFAIFILYLLDVPYLKLVGALLLVWIAVKLVLPEDMADEGDVAGSDNLWNAVRTIVIADAVMSLDNVIGIAAAAKGDVVLIVIGLLVSIPLIVYGSTLILKALDRFPQTPGGCPEASPGFAPGVSRGLRHIDPTANTVRPSGGGRSGGVGQSPRGPGRRMAKGLRPWPRWPRSGRCTRRVPEWPAAPGR